MTQILSTCTPPETFMLKPQLKLRSTGEHHQKSGAFTNNRHETHSRNIGRTTVANRIPGNGSTLPSTGNPNNKHYRRQSIKRPTIHSHYETNCFIVHFSIVDATRPGRNSAIFSFFRETRNDRTRARAVFDVSVGEATEWTESWSLELLRLSHLSRLDYLYSPANRIVLTDPHSRGLSSRHVPVTGAHRFRIVRVIL